MSYFRFYNYKAIRKVLFLPILIERSYKEMVTRGDVSSLQKKKRRKKKGLIKVLFMFFNETSIIRKCQYRKQFRLNGLRSERGNVLVNTN